jgi:hypothetical protein
LTLFRDHSELGLIDHNDDAFNFAALCRGEEMRGEIIHKLKCYHDNRGDPWFTLQPVKVEQVHLTPDIFLFHDIVTTAELEDIKKTAGPLVRISETRIMTIITRQLCAAGQVPGDGKQRRIQ